MKSFIVLAVLIGSFSAFAGTSAMNCTVTSAQASEGDNDQFATIECGSININVVAKSDSVKATLLAAKVADKKISIVVDADNAFQKSERLNKLIRIELN